MNCKQVINIIIQNRFNHVSVFVCFALEFSHEAVFNLFSQLRQKT